MSISNVLKIFSICLFFFWIIVIIQDNQYSMDKCLKNFSEATCVAILR